MLLELLRTLVDTDPWLPDFVRLAALFDTVVRPFLGLFVPIWSEWSSDIEYKEAFSLKQYRSAAEDRKELEKKNKGGNSCSR